MSERVVTYEGFEIHLSIDEYVELRRATDDDPVRADQMARDFLERERKSAQ